MNHDSMKTTKSWFIKDLRKRRKERGEPLDHCYTLKLNVTLFFSIHASLYIFVIESTTRLVTVLLATPFIIENHSLP